MSRVVVLAGGSPHAHDFAASGVALADLARRDGHDATLVDDVDRAADLLTGDVDVLVVDGLWWRMDGDAYAPWRDVHAYSPPPSTRAAIAEFVHGGGGLVAVHTATICFDDWPGWGDLLGGAWKWGVSSHPPLGPVEAQVVAEHPVVAGLPPTIELVDEVYGDLAIDADIEVLAVARRDADDADQPVVWTHRVGAGRVVVDGFGHDVDSIRHRHNSRILTQALGWVARRN